MYLEVMAIKVYSVLSSASDMETHHWMQVSELKLFCRDAIDVFYSAPTYEDH